MIANRFMSNHIAIDTSVLVGLMNPNDIWHGKAKQLFNQLQADEQNRLIVFDCVLAECVSVICRRLQEKRRSIELHGFLTAVSTQFPPHAITWIMPNVPQMYTAVLDLMRQSAGQLNFNDAMIALACQKHKFMQIASFDADFDLVPWVKRIDGSPS